MKINKIKLKISHLFGFRKNEHHIDDVCVNIFVSWEEKNEVYIDKESISIVDNIKKQIFKYFENDQKLESRCRESNQVWITFYDTHESKEGSLMKMLYYEDGILYYPRIDKESYDRNKKLKEIFTK